jgi:hypothetical protein
VLGWLCAIFAVALAAMVVIFVLDFFQARAQVRPQFKQAMDVATETSLVKQTLTILTLVLLARLGLTGRKAVVRKEAVVAEPAPTPLIPLTGSGRAE